MILSANPSPAPLCVRVGVAARMIGIGRTKFYELINAGEVETIKLGTATLIPTASLAALVERQRGTDDVESRCAAHSAINSRRFAKKSVRR